MTLSLGMVSKINNIKALANTVKAFHYDSIRF